MKKILALLMVAVMCFSLAACGGNNEINIKKVDVVGTWINTSPASHGMKMVIEEDGTGSVTLGEQVVELVWERIDDDTLTINADSKELVFEMGVSNGVVELLWQDTFSHYTMVSEQDYNNMIEVVEITADNWQNYLEIETFVDTRTDDFNDIIDLTVGHALVLKDEYVSKISAADGAIEYSFSEKSICPIEYKVATKEFTFGTAYTKEEAENKGHYIDTSYTETNTEKLGSYGEYGFVFGSMRGCYPDSFQAGEDVVTADMGIWGNVEITRIQGDLYFKK